MSNMIITIQPSYEGARKMVTSGAGDNSGEIRKRLIALSGLDSDLLDKWPDEKNYFQFYARMIMSIDDAQWLSSLGVEYEVKRWAGTYETTEWARRAVGMPEGTWAQAPVHVHIPNVGLLFMTEVTVLEDSCTDELQRYLNLGWRIIAVCPPNSVRRPDYVLGRHKDSE